MGWVLGLGNGIVFRQGGSQNWSTYWASRTVTDLTITVDSDTQFTVNWNNNGVTDYTGHKAYVSTDNVTYSLNKTVAAIQTSMTITELIPGTLYYIKIVPYKGSNEGTTNIYAVDLTTADMYIKDAQKVAYFLPRYADMTMNASYQISQWNDLSGNDNHLINDGVDNNKPVLSTQGVYFGRYGRKTWIKKALTFGQPEYLYLVIKIHALRTGTDTNTLTDGNGSSNRMLITFAPSAFATTWGISAGTLVNSTLNAATCVAKSKIFRAIFNGASSILKIMNADSGNINANTQAANAIRFGNAYTDDDATYGNYKLIEAIVKSGAAYETEIYDYLYNKYFKDRTFNIVWEGHSMINPLEVGADIALPDHTLSWLKINHQILTFPTTNFALGGNQISDVVARQSAYLNNYLDTTSGVKNILVVFIGSNDIASGMSGSDAYNALSGYITQAITDGWTPVIITMTKRGDSTVNTQRLIYNNAIKTNSNWHYIIDVDSIPELVDNTNTTYYNADQIHLINAGNDILGRYLAAKMAEIS